MKIQHLLEAPSKLQAFVTKNGTSFQKFGDVQVFLWTDQILAALIKAGAKTNEDLNEVSVPNEMGLGLVNVATGEVCVGAIDIDYDALWASSQDVSDFFVATKNKTLIRLPNRLQNLADLLKEAANPEEAGGVDAIIDYIEENGIENVDVGAIKGMNSADEVKSYLEDQRDSAQEALNSVEKEQDDLTEQAKKFWKMGNKSEAAKIMKKIKELSGSNDSIVFDIEDILKQRHLFSDQSGTDTSAVDADIKKWVTSFNRDFPDLDLSDARELAPE